jgi:tRNA pseudouridine38-40 synthase
MARFALLLEFAGTTWAGTASQHNTERTLQGAFRPVLTGIADGEDRWLVCCGRLDAGVSALAFTGHCDLPRDWAPLVLGRMLNARLPREICVARVARVADDWHARRSAHAKTYCYRVHERGTRSALAPQVWWQRRLAHPERLQPYADRLVGVQDLSGFACLRHDISDNQDTATRRIDAAQWQVEPYLDGRLWSFRITAPGFLYKQVRGLVGALIAIAHDHNGKARHRFEQALADGRGSRYRSGDIAPPDGLLLETVHYDPLPAWVLID